MVRITENIEIQPPPRIGVFNEYFEYIQTPPLGCVESVMMETDKNIYFDKQNNNMATNIHTNTGTSVSK